MKIRTPFFALIILFVMACKGQQKETYWKTVDVTRVSGKRMTGVTLSYMEMLANLQIHLSTNKDSLLFSYPDEKKIKISELKSFTNCRLKGTGELLDSVYEIKVEQDSLRIKFKYVGTDNDNLFKVNLVKVNKADYLADVAKLKARRKEVLSKLKTVDASALDLNIQKPDYFNRKDLQNLNPIQLAQEICDVPNITKNFVSQYRFETSKQIFLGMHLAVENPPKNIAAQVKNINFNGLQFVQDTAKKVNLALVLSNSDIDEAERQQLFDLLSAKYPNAQIENNGLPIAYGGDKDLGNSIAPKSISITWVDASTTTTFMISNIPKDIFENDRITIPNGDKNPAIVKNVFKTYLNKIDRCKVKIVIVDKTFYDALQDVKNGWKPEIFRDL